MNRSCVQFAIVTVALGVGCASSKSVAPAATQPAAAPSLAGVAPAAAPGNSGPMVPMFNGKDLTGFYSFLPSKGRDNDTDHVFTVQDGMLHVSGQEFGYVATLVEYENYHLSAEFKWGTATHPPRVDKARDNGILFHMSGPDKVWPTSVEFQFIEGGTGDLLLVDGPSIDFDESLRSRLAAGSRMLSPDGKRIVRGRLNWAGRAPDWKDRLGMRGPNDLEKPLGEWNTVTLHVDTGTVIYTLNGTEVVHVTGVSPRKGRILFQSEGAEMFLRNAQIRVLPGTMP